MQSIWSYIKDLGDLNRLKNSILVTADVVGLYPSIQHDTGLKAFEDVLEKRKANKIGTDNLTNLAKFALQSYYFECNRELKQKISGTAIGIKFAPRHLCIFMDHAESEFLENQQHQPLVWFRYIDDIFSSGLTSMRN